MTGTMNEKDTKARLLLLEKLKKKGRGKRSESVGMYSLHSFICLALPPLFLLLRTLESIFCKKPTWRSKAGACHFSSFVFTHQGLCDCNAPC